MNAITDLRHTTVAKSDQLNADDLIGGPLTITVTEVSLGPADQPVTVHYEGENGRPFKPCKTMRRVLIFAWGENGNDWCGKSMTLYRDPDVKFGGELVGGIRISHMSHMEHNLTLSLNQTRGKKGKYSVQRMQAPQQRQTQSRPASNGSDDLTPVTAEQVVAMETALADRGATAEALCHAAGAHLGLPIQRLDQIPASFYGKACGWIAKQNPAPPSDFE